MAHMNIAPKFNVDLSSAEMRLIIMALGGRLKGGKDADEARKLGDELYGMRAKLTMDYANAQQPKADDSSSNNY